MVVGEKKAGDGSRGEAWIGQRPIWLVRLDIYPDIYLWLCFYLLCLTLCGEDICTKSTSLSLSCYFLEVNELFSLGQTPRILSLRFKSVRLYFTHIQVTGSEILFKAMKGSS